MNKTLKYYLAIYNLGAFSFWLSYLVCYMLNGLQLNMPGMVLLSIARGLALLEILHAALRWVKSPVLSTLAQVASRVLVVVLIGWYMYFGASRYVLVNEQLRLHSYAFWAGAGILIVSFAWSITELVRYSFYFLQLFNRQPHWLLWMRYTFFIVLYPTGVTGEWLIIAAPLLAVPLGFSVYGCFTGVLFLVYAGYFPVLYRYMWQQRKARL